MSGSNVISGRAVEIAEFSIFYQKKIVGTIFYFVRATSSLNFVIPQKFIQISLIVFRNLTQTFDKFFLINVLYLHFTYLNFVKVLIIIF